jgi:hypothetical protein
VILLCKLCKPIRRLIKYMKAFISRVTNIFRSRTINPELSLGPWHVAYIFGAPLPVAGIEVLTAVVMKSSIF